MEPGPIAALGALIVGLLVGQRTGTGPATVAVVAGMGAFGGAWFARPPMRAVLAAAACALLGCAVMSRAIDGQQHSPLGAALEHRESVTLSGEATDELRVKTEKESFEQLLNEIELTWKGIVEQHASQPVKTAEK